MDPQSSSRGQVVAIDRDLRPLTTRQIDAGRRIALLSVMAITVRTRQGLPDAAGVRLVRAEDGEYPYCAGCPSPPAAACSAATSPARRAAAPPPAMTGGTRIARRQAPGTGPCPA